MKRLIFAVFLLISIARFSEATAEPQRIVSMSPAVTEILCELGLEDKVAGVTDYCNFPESIKNKTRIGCYLNPNYEAIYRLRPDLVIMPIAYGEDVKAVFDKAEIKCLFVSTFTIDDILDSTEKIGSATGRVKEAAGLNARLTNELKALKENARKRHPERVMIVVGRNAGSFDDLYIAGRGTFYDELLSTARCENVCDIKGIQYPAISVESVMRLNPDVIIEILPGCLEEDKPRVISEWKVLKDVTAVKNGKISVLSGDYEAIPGPRFILILKDIESVL